MSRKVAKVTDVRELDYPKLGWIYDPHDTYGRGPLHIADRDCQHGKWRKELARCGRPIDFDQHFNSGTTKVQPTLENFRMCKRCGTEAEFQEALAKHIQGHAEWVEQYRKRRAAEEAEREAQNKERGDRANRLRNTINLPIIEDRQYVLAFEFEGYRYSISECGPIMTATNQPK